MRGRLVLGLMLLVVLLSGCLGGGSSKVITRYQCYDGSVVSYLNECSNSANGGGTPNTIVQTTVSSSGGSPTVTSCPTTIPCNCFGQKTTTSVPPKLGPICTSDGECGTLSYGAIRCQSGDAYKVKNTPKCDLDNYDGQMHCKTLSELELYQECTDTQRCAKDKGCVAYTEESE